MSTPATYTPQEGSAPWKVIQFLQANPDEQLDADIIAVKCDCSRANVHTLLRHAVEANLLKREEDRPTGELVYSLGAAAAAQLPTSALHSWLERKGQDPAEGRTARRKGAATAPHAAEPTSPATPAAPTTGRAKRSRPYWVDISTVAIEKGVPMSGRGNKGMDWAPLLSKMAVGDSFSQPKNARSSLTTAMKAQKESTGKVFSSEMDEAGIRVWRVS